MHESIVIDTISAGMPRSDRRVAGLVYVSIFPLILR